MKTCPKCQFETNESEWEYCRPCKDDNEFVRLVLVETCWDCTNALKTELELKKKECNSCYVQRKT